ncbi:cytochrome c biogenesis protein ResB [Porphyromonas uenonis]|uniref:cytochrome c biogenesis protein ResB n=1 Tax=Porphyromonas uenonis TaxID=281920 RepID=UPI001EE1D11F|nr:cytochrome c biogenesis protein ResB [Porphyromonas uenonis]
MVWRKLPFILLLITVAVLATATVVEKLYGTPFVQEHWYGSPLFTILWVLLSCAGLLYILRVKLYRRFWIWMIHVSLLVILLGAGLTSWTAIHGRIKLQEGATPTARYQSDQGETLTLPFAVALERFDLTYYTGTQFPLDYQSNLIIQDGERSQSLRGAVSMNRIFRYRFYRFYQSGYDPETTSSILSVAYDPWGIAISYLGYALLAISLVGGMYARRHRVRQLLKQALVSPVAMLLILLAGGTLSAEAKAPATPLPKTVPANVAKSLGELHILYNNRVCPLGTYAQEFTEKLYGRSSYRGLSAEQVLAGWIFYYDNWVDEPMIRIKDRSIRKLLECYEGQRVSYRQFFDIQGNYRLESLLDNYIQHPDQPGRKALFEAHEKCQVIQSLGLGESLAIFPVQSHGSIAWYHPASTDLPAEMPLDQWTFVRKGFNYLSELVIMQQWDEAQEFLVKLRQYQLKEGAESCPSALRFRSEIYYNQLSPYIGLLAKILATVGILLFIWTAYQLSVGRLQDPPLVKWCFWGILYASMLYLTLMVILRWIVSGYVLEQWL